MFTEKEIAYINSQHLARLARVSKSMSSEWLALDLGEGKLGAMALALEDPDHTVLLDDVLAGRTTQVTGLQVSGTLRVLLEAESQGLIVRIEPSCNEFR